MSFALLSVLGALMLLAHANVFAQKSVRVSSETVTDPEEVTIAINPKQPQNLIAGANIHYSFNSRDGGTTWTQQRIESQHGVWGDPMVLFDSNGVAYYAHLSNPTSGTWIDRIVVQRSIDGGDTWSPGVGIGHNGERNQDKQWMVIDNTQSKYRGTMYVSWTEFDKYGSKVAGDSSRILFSRSTDGGQTWSTPVKVSDVDGDCIDNDGTNEGAVPAVGQNGDVYMCWSNIQGIMFDKSTDGGATWGTDKLVTTQIGGWDQVIGGLQRCNGLPVTLCDQSPSANAGTIYLVFSDQRNGTDNTDVFVITSTDGGSTWSQVSRVNNDVSRRHQFMPAAAIDPIDGRLWIVYYDRSHTSGNATDVYASVSSDGAKTFRQIKVSETSFTPLANVFFGDYIGIAAYAGAAHPIWMRCDENSNLSVWTTAIVDTATSGTRIVQPTTATKNELKIVPNPSQRIFNVTVTLAKSGRIQLAIYNVRGSLIRVIAEGEFEQGVFPIQWDGTDRLGKNVAKGTYYCRLMPADSDSVVKAIVKR